MLRERGVDYLANVELYHDGGKSLNWMEMPDPGPSIGDVRASKESALSRKSTMSRKTTAM